MARGPVRFQVSLKADELPKWAATFPDAIGHALYEEALDIFAASQRLVPVDTGALRNSGSVTKSDLGNGVIEVVIGYGGPAIGYAEKVHDTPPGQAHHAPPTQWKYLEVPFNNATRGQQNRIIGRAKDLLAGFGINPESAGTATFASDGNAAIDTTGQYEG